MKKIYLMAMVMIAILLGGNSVKAQFSPDCLDNTWTKAPCIQTTMTFPNGSVCDITICYCYKVVNGVYTYYVSGCGFGEACGSDAEVNAILIAASRKLLDLNPLNAPCPPCPGVATTIVTFSSCNQIIINPDHTAMLVACNALGICTQTYTICCNPLTGVKTITYGSTTSVGVNTCSGGSAGCTPFCP